MTGGAGFVGSHLVDTLMLDGHQVFVADNYFTGTRRNIEQWIGHENFEMGKRVAETIAYAYHKQSGVDVRVARIFNTYGPRMHANDGRVVSNFVIQVGLLFGKDFPSIKMSSGVGEQTHHNLRFRRADAVLPVRVVRVMKSDYTQPVNIGNPEERSINSFAALIRDLVPGSGSRIVHKPAVEDDPQRRRPDISTARQELGWAPSVSIEKGLAKTIEYFRKELGRSDNSEKHNGDATEYVL